MIKIYHTDTQAIICDEQLKVFWSATKKDAVELSRSIKSSISRREALAYAVELLLTNGYNEVDFH